MRALLRVRNERLVRKRVEVELANFRASTLFVRIGRSVCFEELQ